MGLASEVFLKPMNGYNINQSIPMGLASEVLLKSMSGYNINHLIPMGIHWGLAAMRDEWQ